MAFVLTVRSATRVAAPIVTVFVLDPLPTVTFGRIPVGVKLPTEAVPVNNRVPGPLTPFVVVPIFEKVPDTVRIWPLLIINVLVVALRVRLVTEALAVMVTAFPAAIITLSVARGTTPLGQGALTIVEFQLPLPAVVIVAPFTFPAPTNNPASTIRKTPIFFENRKFRIIGFGFE